jgi:hypothetical protein
VERPSDSPRRRLAAFASNTEFRRPEKRGFDSQTCRWRGGHSDWGIRALKSGAVGNAMAPAVASRPPRKTRFATFFERPDGLLQRCSARTRRVVLRVVTNAAGNVHSSAVRG